jgi:hypothetical protein
VIEKRQCMRCGTELPYGSLVYVVQIKVFADFDGVILDPDEESQEPMEKLLEQIQKADPKGLEKEVYEELMFVLCKQCRDRFVDETQHSGDMFFPLPNGSDRILH